MILLVLIKICFNKLINISEIHFKCQSKILSDVAGFCLRCYPLVSPPRALRGHVPLVPPLELRFKFARGALPHGVFASVAELTS